MSQWTHLHAGSSNKMIIHTIVVTIACDLAGPTKMFLLACSSLQEDSIPAGFLYKRGFQIRMKKGTQVKE